jgi:DNA-binding MarR family transcriptional regulator
LPSRTSQLSRLLLRRVGAGLSRSEGGLLVTLADGPRRITELAELEGLAQPTMTLLVKRRQERGWVVRDRHAGDGRVVLVSLTDLGRTELEDLRRRYEAMLREYLAALSDEQLHALVAAAQALCPLIDVLQAGEPRP